MKTLAAVLLRNATHNPDDLAVADHRRRLTHRQLAEHGWQLAHGLFERSLKVGSRFAVLSQNNAEFLELYAAAECSGLVLTTLNWRLAEQDLLQVLNDCTPEALFFEKQYAEVVQRLAAAMHARPLLVCMDESLGWAEDFSAIRSSENSPPAAPQPDSLAYLIYTSGTTGRPKGVMLSQGALASAAAACALDVGVRRGDRILLTMPLFHIGARIEGLDVQYLAGAQLLLRQFDPLKVFETIVKERATTAHLAPVMIKTLVEHPLRRQFDLGSLSSIRYGSAPMPVAELLRANEAFGQIFSQSYGMTEHLPCSVMTSDQQKPYGTPAEVARLASAGQAVRGTDIAIADSEGKHLPQGEVGEILLRSASMMQGYWNQPEATAATLQNGWLHSGDVGYLDDQQYLFIVDRKKDMIISGGENIYSREVEDALLMHPAVSVACVIGIPDERWGEGVHAVVVLRAGFSTTEAELVVHVRSLIASYKKPRSIKFVTEVPRLATGKVDKKRLREPYWAGLKRQLG